MASAFRSGRAALARTAHAVTPLDVALTALAFGVAVVLMTGERFAPADGRALDGAGVALAAVAALPVLLRRTWPAVAFVVSGCATAALYGSGYSLGPAVAAVICLYAVAAAPEGGRVRQVRIAVAVVPLGILAAVHLSIRTGTEGVLAVLVFAAAWITGDWMRRRDERMRALEQRAADGERAVERERRLAVAEERTRIARDLHDSAGHALSVILMQSAAARLTRRHDPEASDRALEIVESVARETMDDLGRIVRRVRAEAGTDMAAPGLASVASLVERFGGAPCVRVSIAGQPRQLPAMVDQAAYRIIQEGLTNAERHGVPPITVEIRHGERELRVEVANAVAGGTTGAGGHGLIGMQERAEILGGTLEVEDGRDRFAVRARLPVATAA